MAKSIAWVIGNVLIAHTLRPAVLQNSVRILRTKCTILLICPRARRYRLAKKQVQALSISWVEVHASTKKPIVNLTMQESIAQAVREAVADAIAQFTPEDQVVVNVRTEVLSG